VPVESLAAGPDRDWAHGNRHSSARAPGGATTLHPKLPQQTPSERADGTIEPQAPTRRNAWRLVPPARGGKEKHLLMTNELIRNKQQLRVELKTSKLQYSIFRSIAIPSPAGGGKPTENLEAIGGWPARGTRLGSVAGGAYGGSPRAQGRPDVPVGPGGPGEEDGEGQTDWRDRQRRPGAASWAGQGGRQPVVFQRQGVGPRPDDGEKKAIPQKIAGWRKGESPA
jgi:hypothetical protein